MCLGAYLLLHTDEVDHDGAEDEPVEKHDRLEASVPEEGGHHSEHEVEGAHGGRVGVVLADNADMLLNIRKEKLFFINKFFFVSPDNNLKLCLSYLFYFHLYQQCHNSQHLDQYGHQILICCRQM